MPLSNVTVVDDKCSPVTLVDKKTGANPDATPSTLDPVDTWHYSCTIPGADVHASEDGNHLIINTVIASGDDGHGHTPTDEDTHTTKVEHPAIRIDKNGPATALAGTTITYVLDVTNPGDVSFAASTVIVTDDLCTPVLSTKNNDATPNSLDPGDKWTYTCDVQTQAGATLVHNTANVEGTSDHGKKVTSTDTADTTLEQPQPVNPAGKPTGTASLTGPSGCVSKRVKVKVNGTGVQQVVYKIDGKKVKTVTAAPFSYSFSTGKYNNKPHRLTGEVTFLPSANTKATTLRLRFQKCKVRKLKPKFTG